MANVIQRVQRPTLVLAHNKTLAAQLCSEFQEFFPESAVEYFVSYYDYYQPEAYIAQTDTYIEKDSAINDEIDKLRHSATSALSERRDVIIVASVSCIYSLGDPIDYRTMVISLRPGMEKNRDELLKKLVELQYERNDINFIRNKFRVRGDVVEIFPAESSDKAVRVEFFGDEIERLREFNPLTGDVLAELKHIAIYPASHYIVPKGEDGEGHWGYSGRNGAAGGIFLNPRASSSRRSALNSVPGTTWRCSRRSASAKGLRTIPGCFPAGIQAARPLHCWTISLRISCFLWMNLM